jgi:hypothetical protein
VTSNSHLVTLDTFAFLCRPLLDRFVSSPNSDNEESEDGADEDEEHEDESN